MFGTKVLIFSTATILKPPKARHFALRNLHYLQLYWISPSGQIYVCKIGQSIKIIYTVTTFISWRGILLCYFLLKNQQTQENSQNELLLLMETVTTETVNRNKTKQNQPGTRQQHNTTLIYCKPTYTWVTNFNINLWCSARFSTICTIEKTWKHLCRSVTFSTEWVSFTFSKFYKWYQITQSV